MIAIIFILFISIFLTSYTYFLYPILLSILAKGKKIEGEEYAENELPKIAIVFAAYNEEKVIEAKMKNLATLNYPAELLEIHIGLDCPDDATASIIEANKAMKFPVFVHHYKERSGKANVLNKLFSYGLQLSDFELFIMMDANIISKPNAVFELVKYFKNKEIGQVGAVIENVVDRVTEIAEQEKFYIGNESQLKVNEGLVFGSTIGAFGACYAIRSKFIKPIPSNYLMEDFYLSMHVLESGAKAITNPNAIVFEDLPGTIQEEFKRKKRISTGNFQNLKTYFSLLWKSNFNVAFTFLSHKILRWLSPFFMLIAIASSTILYFMQPNSILFCSMFYLMLANLFLPIIDIALQSVNINVNLLRLHRYFILMNIALLLGFINWLKGVKTNIWKPTERT